MTRDWFMYGSKRSRLLLLTLQLAMLAAAWAVLRPANPGLLGYALLYVGIVWVAAGAVMFGGFMGTSLAPFSELLAAAVRGSANAMWLVPGVLALTTRSMAVTALGLAVVINSTRLLALSRAPSGIKKKRRRIPHEGEPEEALFQPQEAPQFSPEIIPAMAGGLALQAGIWALYQNYPVPAAVSFGVVTVLWVSTSVTHGAQHARRNTTVLYGVPVALLTLLLTITLTAALLSRTVVPEMPPAPDILGGNQPPSLTRHMLSRIAHVPPPPPPADVGPPKPVAELVDPATAARQTAMKTGIPGVVLRPPAPAEKPPIVFAGARFHFTADRQSLAFPFSGEYELFRVSSVSLPNGAPRENGSPLDSLFGTTNGEPMQTVAVQPFDPPLDLTNCGKVLVDVTSSEKYPVLVAMQLVTAGSIEDGGSDLLGIKGAREQMLEFEVPELSRPLLVRAIRIAFQRSVSHGSTNVRIAVKRFTLLTRGF